jgi:hypothetical protein
MGEGESKPAGGQPAEPEPEHAAVDWLLSDSVHGKALPKVPEVKPTGDEVFEVVGSGMASDWDLVNPIPVTAAGSRPRSAAAASAPADPGSLVPEVWSRLGEWGPNLAVLVGFVLVIGFLVYLIVGMGMYLLAMLLMLAGTVAATVLAYPILITLERPVRMTPEQAVRDYYAALSHHVPHTRRMWLLLAAAGRVSPSYGSYEGFRAYWLERLRELRAGHAGPLTPLVFEVAEFKSDKSGGKTEIEVKFTVKVYVRGRRDRGPIWQIPCRISLARGPDRMWYLENGMLPYGSAGRAVRG